MTAVRGALSYEGHDVIASTKRTALSIAPDAVDPQSVPKRTLYTGAKIPVLGLGTFGSDRFTGEQIADAVLGAAAVGYRHFDCASVYGNEPQIGHSLRAIVDGGIAREDLWVTSKLWNDKHGEADVIPSCEQSLRDLQLDYLDLYLIHWPFPNFHPPGCDVGSRSKDARPYLHDNYMKTWRQMEALVDRGLVRHIGTSNMTVAKLKLVLRDARCRLQAEWAPLWETSGYHLSGCGVDCSTTLGIKPVRRLDSRPLRDCRADQGRIDSLSGPGPMFR